MTGSKTGVRWRIGEVAERTGLPPTTIRFYEKTFGFYLRPERSAGGHRRYSEETVRRLLYLKYLLHTKGLSIHDVHQRLLKEEDPQALRKEVDALHRAFEAVTREVHRLKQAMNQLTERLTRLEDQLQNQGRKRLFR